jgi:hypothetical protein
VVIQTPRPPESMNRKRPPPAAAAATVKITVRLTR